MKTDYTAFEEIKTIFDRWHNKAGIFVLPSLPYWTQFYKIKKIFKTPLRLKVSGERAFQIVTITHVDEQPDSLILTVSPKGRLVLKQAGFNSIATLEPAGVIEMAVWEKNKYFTASLPVLYNYIGIQNINFVNVVIHAGGCTWLILEYKRHDNLILGTVWRKDKFTINFSTFEASVSTDSYSDVQLEFPVKVLPTFTIPDSLPDKVPLEKYMVHQSGEHPFIEAFMNYIQRFKAKGDKRKKPVSPVVTAPSPYIEKLIETGKKHERSQKTPYYNSHLTAFKEYVLLFGDMKNDCMQPILAAIRAYSHDLSTLDRKILAAKATRAKAGNGKEYFIESSKQFLQIYHLPSLGRSLSKRQESQILDAAEPHLLAEWGEKPKKYRHYWDLLAGIVQADLSKQITNAEEYVFGGLREYLATQDERCVPILEELRGRFFRYRILPENQFGIYL